MEKRIFDFSDSRLLAGAAALYELSMVAGTDGFSLLAADPTGTVLALKSWQFDNYDGGFDAVESDLRQILGSESLLQQPFSRVRCAVFNRWATLVPRRLFNAAELPSYFQLLMPAGEYDYQYESLHDLDCFLVYAVEKNTAELLQRNFPTLAVTHLAAPVLQKALELAGSDSPVVFVNIRNEVAQVAAFERGNLLFYNSFSYDKASDLLYFVLLTYEQCRLNPDQIPLMLSGTMLPDSEIYKLLYRYIRNIGFAPATERYYLPPEAQPLPDHFFFDLFSLKS